eukprot:8813202-Lingulodinium_polyedra.AAC.1
MGTDARNTRRTCLAPRESNATVASGLEGGQPLPTGALGSTHGPADAAGAPNLQRPGGQRRAPRG